MKKIAICLISFTLIISCGRWKTTKLKPDQLCVLKAGTGAGEIKLDFDKNDILNISFGIEFHEGYIYTADNLLKRVQVLKPDGTPLLLIGKKEDKAKNSSGVRKSSFNFSIIGSMAVDSDDNIYVQNRFASSDTAERITDVQNLGFAPTYILAFDSSGKLLYTLGKRGGPDIPFNYIETMAIDGNDRLVVITRSFDTWSVFIFKEKKRIFEENFGEADFKAGNVAGRIETIKPFMDGKNILISIAYYENTDFKYRKIFNYSIEKTKIDRTVMTVPDPQNELFSIINDKLIYLWDVKEDDLKFIVCNLSGNIINNISMDLPDKREFYNNIFIDENGQFYSIHVINKAIEIMRWR